MQCEATTLCECGHEYQMHAHRDLENTAGRCYYPNDGSAMGCKCLCFRAAQKLTPLTPAQNFVSDKKYPDGPTCTVCGALLVEEKCLSCGSAQKLTVPAQLQEALMYQKCIHGNGPACPECTHFPATQPPSASEGDGERTYPTGGDPNEFCVCKHHKLNHAAYLDMPTACNQTNCDCAEYRPANPSPAVDAAPDAKELFDVEPYSPMDAVMGACGILDVIKSEWGESWSEHDQKVRAGLSAILAADLGGQKHIAKLEHYLQVSNDALAMRSRELNELVARNSEGYREGGEETCQAKPAVDAAPDLIKHMTERFLGWQLPENFNPDGGISFQQYGNVGTEHQYENVPTGTNLLDYTQAEAMVRYMLDRTSPHECNSDCGYFPCPKMPWSMPKPAVDAGEPLPPLDDETLRKIKDFIISKLLEHKATGEHEGQPYSGIQYALDVCVDLVRANRALEQRLAASEGEKQKLIRESVADFNSTEDQLAERDRKIAELESKLAALTAAMTLIAAFKNKTLVGHTSNDALGIAYAEGANKAFNQAAEIANTALAAGKEDADG
jgi:hypothetical protein